MSQTFPVKVENDQAIMRLESVLDMAVADAFLGALTKTVVKHNSLVLDAEDVERVSTPCVQVMLAAALKMERTGGHFLIKNISSGFERGMRELGLVEYLEKWSRSL